MSEILNFGQYLLRTDSVEQWLETERKFNKSQAFAELDTLVDSLLFRSLAGERIATIKFAKQQPISFILEGVTTQQRAFIDETFTVKRQQSRGALFHPDKVKICSGYLNLPWFYKTIPRFAIGAAQDESGSLVLKNNADAVFVWAVLEPLFFQLLTPLVLCGDLGSKKTFSVQQGFYSDTQNLLSALGFSPRDGVTSQTIRELRPMSEQIILRQQFLDYLKGQIKPGMAARYRALRLQSFVRRYYEKAHNGKVTRKRALNKVLEPTLAGFFGGDWLALLQYIEEELHPDENIVTALPNTKLFLGAEGRVAEVAAETGLPEAEVRLMVQSFWDDTTDASPVEKRVRALQEYWKHFDAVHDNQKSGMKPLWGLVAEGHGIDIERDQQKVDEEYDSPFQPGLYRKLLPPSIQSQIEVLWGEVLLPRYPERKATAINPHTLMAEAFGTALKFWHGCALTAWFFCEGPYSRTSIAEMTEYYKKILNELHECGTPIDARLFEELIIAQRKLGPEKSITEKEEILGEPIDGITFSISVSHGTRRDGFEFLRDVISRHRKAWAQRYLDTYLKSRWESEIRGVAQEFQHAMYSQGKAPRLSTFAKIAVKPTNHWFGGDISRLYRAIGEKAPIQPTYARVMPRDTTSFHFAVRAKVAKFKELYEGGIEREWPYYLQLQEALGRQPAVEEFGRGRNDYFPQLMKQKPKLWNAFVKAIEEALNDTTPR